MGGALNPGIGPGVAHLWGERAAAAASLNGEWHVDAPPFNAKGDGTSNDAPAIQAAIAACSAAGGGIVKFGPSDYKLLASLVCPDHVCLRGCGPGATRLIYDGTEAVIECTYTAYHASNVTEQVGVERMTISAVDASAGSIGIDFTQNQYGWIREVEVIQCETGVKLAGKAVCNSLVDVTVGQATTSFLITNGANGCDLYNCSANVPTGGIGVLISAGANESTTGITLSGLTIDGAGTATLVDMAGSGSNIVQGVAIVGARLEGGTNGVRAAATLVREVVVVSPYFSSVTNAVVDTAGVVTLLGSTLGLRAVIRDATASAATDVLTATHLTSGTPADGIGAGLLFRAQDDAGTPALTEIAAIRGVLVNNGAGSEDSEIQFLTRTAGAAKTAVARILNAALLVGATATTGSAIARVSGIMIVDTDGTAVFRVMTASAAADVLKVDTTNGQVNAQGGFATTGFHFVGDENTGMTNPAADTLALRVGGTERFSANGTGISFFAAAEVAQQASGANLTNNVTSGGTNDTVDNIVAAAGEATAADLTTTRDALYQLARKLKQVNDALRLYGLLT